jgi:hypothetical protein
LVSIWAASARRWMQQRPLSFGLNLARRWKQQQASFGLNSAGLSPAMNAMQQRPPSFGLNPMMNAAAATLLWSQFGRPQPDDSTWRG